MIRGIATTHLIPRKRNEGSTGEAQLGEAPFDATRTARLLRATDGSIRVSLVNVGTGQEFASIPVADQSREGMASVMKVMLSMRDRIAASATPPPPAEPAFVPNFADKVETLARHIAAMQRRASSAALAKAGRTPPSTDDDPWKLDVEPGSQYWYLRGRFVGRRWAIDTRTGLVSPVSSKGVMADTSGTGQGMKRFKPPGFPIEDMGRYDWTTLYYFPPKLERPEPVTWVRSTLEPPKPPTPKPAPEDRTIRIVTAPTPGSWTPRGEVSSGAVRTPGDVIGSQGWKGGRYDETKGMPTSEIAALMRQDIKGAIKNGELPPMDVSVAMDNSRTSSSINITVRRLKHGIPLATREYVELLGEDGQEKIVGRNVEVRTPEAREILRRLQAIHDRYNFDNSDPQSDYFNVRYYGEARFSDDAWRQSLYDMRAQLGIDKRRDAYIESSIRAALLARPETKKLRWNRDVRVYQNDANNYTVQWLNTESRPYRVISYADGAPEDLLEYVFSFASEGSRKSNPGAAQLAVMGAMGAGSAIVLGRGMLAERRAKQLDAQVLRALAPMGLDPGTRIAPANRDGVHVAPRLSDLAASYEFSHGFDDRKRRLIERVRRGDFGAIGIGRDHRGVMYLTLPEDGYIEVMHSRRHGGVR